MNLNNSLSPDKRFEKSRPCSTMGVYDKMIPLGILLNVLNTHAVFIFNKVAISVHIVLLFSFLQIFIAVRPFLKGEQKVNHNRV